MPSLRHLNSLQAVEAAVRLGSQKAAGLELGISAAAVGQRIRSLEDYLGTDLLIRGRSGVMPTPALQSALESLSSGFESLAEAADLLSYSSHNTIRLHADPDWAALWLQPRLPEFLDAYPHYEILLETRGSPMGRHDLSVFRSNDKEGGEFLYHDYLLPVCSPENFARIVDLPDGDKLEGFPLLHLVQEGEEI
jgi:LysR family glycine cleavage system transcriptional activator